MKKRTLFLTILCSILTLSSCGKESSISEIISNSISVSKDTSISISYDPNVYEEYEEEDYDANLPPDYYDVDETKVPANDFHTKEQYCYIKSAYDLVSLFARGKAELSQPTYLKFDYRDAALKTKITYFELGLDENFTQSMIYKNDGSIINLYNLFVNQHYYYRVAREEDELKDAEVKEFTTNDTAPRNIRLDGVTNVRDLGGYRSKFGGRIRQGLFYRGARLNNAGDNKPALLLTDAGMKTFTQDLKIKNELDLRYFDEDSDERGYMRDGEIEGCTYNSFPMPGSITVADRMVDEKHKEEIAKLFHLLAKKESYPVYLHCAIGTDRTGLVAYLLENLLGMYRTDIYHDFLFSNFGNIGSSRDISVIKDRYERHLKDYNKKTHASACAQYLMDLGITEEEIISIRKIFIER